ncbi:hypothetical protein [Paenibacillus tyrfis]|uniref:hypothetical protein n=1 Tax=Paenibacillus tyrfis TaxID=1501230 RepID=UPI00209FF1E6|nr:hypothetical protein [Paenibacillus tyrfis]MCP1307846.1 hypothetical protein [Paenibacillus tyrfis]
MTTKTAVQFRKTQATSHLFDRLQQCRRCSRYSCLWDDRCLSCEAEQSRSAVPEQAGAVLKHRRQTGMLAVGAIGALAFLLARNAEQMILSVVGAALLLALFVFLHKRYEAILYRRTLSRLLLQDQQKIREGLLLDIDDAEADLRAEDFKTAYEKFREIGYFIQDDSIKILKVYCLNKFILRSDMDLELSSLLPNRFDKDVIEYMHEIGKVRPQLITREALDYVMKYRGMIERLPEGRDVLTAAAGAALRVKSNLHAYRSLLLDHAQELPKERLLRLCRLLAEQPDADPELTQKARDAVKLKYDFDPEFQGIL